MPMIKVKMNAEQYIGVLVVTTDWGADKNLSGLVELPHTPKEELDKEIVFLKVSGAITFPLWEKFCEAVKMKIPFPGY
jgi:hypothetical protein